ncbi:hypothetical protein KSS87_006518 [Heliosperma pusillum]|nr:hypothetical protein KSS87_006518 [Heliosperma pusillum]
MNVLRNSRALHFNTTIPSQSIAYLNYVVPFNYFCTVNSTHLDQNPEKSYSISAISELIAKQHWGEIKGILKEKQNPNEILNELFDSEVNPRVILSYFNWVLRNCGFSWDIHVFFKLFRLLGNGRMFGEVRKLLNVLVQSGKFSSSEFFHAISLYGDSARENSVLVDMLVQTYMHGNKVELGFEAVRRAWDYGFRLSVLSCNPLLSALVDEGNVKVMEDVFKGMIRRRVRPDLKTFNIVISGFCKAGQLQKASDLLEDIKAWGLSPNAVTYNILISGYCKKAKVGKMYKADALLKEMVAMNILPNEITFNTIIDGFCKDQNLPAAMKVFKEMQNQGLKPGVATLRHLQYLD